MSFVLQMILAFTRSSFNSLLKVSTRTTSTAIASSQQIYRNMSSQQSIDEKFQLPKRYQGQGPSVWWVNKIDLSFHFVDIFTVVIALIWVQHFKWNFFDSNSPGTSTFNYSWSISLWILDKASPTIPFHSTSQMLWLPPQTVRIACWTSTQEDSWVILITISLFSICLFYLLVEFTFEVNLCEQQHIVCECSASLTFK